MLRESIGHRAKLGSPNFSFLERHDPLLLRYAAQAERYVFNDPNTALIKIHQFAEQQQITQRIESLFSYADSILEQAKASLKELDRLDQSILAKAFRGELVPQDPTDEPASVLLKRIKTERAAATATKRSRKKA